MLAQRMREDDIHNMLYGYIYRSPRKIFFHSSNNPGITKSILNKSVSYDVKKNSDGREMAINVKLAGVDPKTKE